MKVWASILCFLWGSSTVAATRTLDYDELPTLIRQSNPGLRAAESGIEAARLRSGTLDHSFLPRLELESGFRGQRETDGSGDQAPYWKVDAASNLYRGGRDAWKEQEIESEVSLRRFDAQAFMRQALLKVRADYIRLAAIRQLIKLNEDLTQSTRLKKKPLRQKIQAGLLSESFATDFLLFEQSLEQDRLFMEKEMHEIEDRLITELGLAQETRLHVKPLASIEMGAEPSPSQLKNLPELKKLELEAETARKTSHVPAEWWRPNVDLFASYTGLAVKDATEPSALPSREAAIGLRFTLDLNHSADLRKDASRLKSEAAALDLKKAYRTREAELRLREYSHDIDALRPILSTLDQHVKTTDSLQRKLDAEFERGVRDSSAVLESIRRVYELKKRRVDSLLEFQTAKAGLQTFLEP
jgi:outer membrane protein TolC